MLPRRGGSFGDRYAGDERRVTARSKMWAPFATERRA